MKKVDTKVQLGIARAKRENRMAVMREVATEIEELDKEIDRLNLEILEIKEED